MINQSKIVKGTERNSRKSTKKINPIKIDIKKVITINAEKLTLPFNGKVLLE